MEVTDITPENPAEATQESEAKTPPEQPGEGAEALDHEAAPETGAEFRRRRFAERKRKALEAHVQPGAEAGVEGESSELLAQAAETVGPAKAAADDPEEPGESSEPATVVSDTGEVTPEQLLIDTFEPVPAIPDAQFRALVEAAIYVTDEPLSAAQIAAALEKPQDQVEKILADLVSDYNRPERGLTVREVAGGYKMGTKPEHHEAVRNFVKNLKPPLKLSLAALETLAVIAYKQPITAPEVMEIRGVTGAGVLKTLLDRKLITTSGRKAVIGKPMLYKTTKDFLVQFGLKDLAELPTLKEFEELRRLAISDEAEALREPTPVEPAPEPMPEPQNQDNKESDEAPPESSTE